MNDDGALGTDFDGGVSVLGLGNGDANGRDPECASAWKNQEAASSEGGLRCGPELSRCSGSHAGGARLVGGASERHPGERRLAFTDIVGSTPATARSGQADLALRERHRRLVSRWVSRYRGD